MNINLEVARNISIAGIKVNLVCNKCHRVWGVYLDENLSFPVGGDKCRNCEISNKENVEHENKIGRDTR